MLEFISEPRFDWVSVHLKEDLPGLQWEVSGECAQVSLSNLSAVCLSVNLQRTFPGKDWIASLRVLL